MREFVRRKRVQVVQVLADLMAVGTILAVLAFLMKHRIGG